MIAVYSDIKFKLKPTISRLWFHILTHSIFLEFNSRNIISDNLNVSGSKLHQACRIVEAIS